MKPYLSPTQFKILAHRGSTEGGATENTIAAFQFAVANGACFLETDIQGTSDGVAVIFHDEDLRRSFGLKEQVANLTYGQLSLIAQSHGVEIPTLSEALTLLSNSRFNIDFKASGAIVPGIESITKANAQDRVLVSSFSRTRRLEALSRVSNVATSADGITLLQLWLSHKLGATSAFAAICARIDAIQIPVKFGPIRFDTPRFLQSIRSFGLEVHFWTINEFPEALRLRSLGATGIVTDKSKMMFERFSAEGIEII